VGAVLSPQIVTSGSPATAMPRGIILATPAAVVEGGDGVKGEGPEVLHGCLVWHGTTARGGLGQGRGSGEGSYMENHTFYLHATLYVRDCI
jgi:hypothetical protein